MVTELGEVQTSLQDSRERVTALKDLVSGTTVVAPDTGVVNGMQVHTIGGVIGPGSPIAEIVPESDELVIEASVNTIDIDRVSEGPEARIRFSTFGSSAPTILVRLFPFLPMRCKTTQPDVFYLARVEVYEEGMEDLGDLALMPGMPAEVYINTEPGLSFNTSSNLCLMRFAALTKTKRK